MTTELIFAFEPFVECTLFYTVNYWFSKYFGIISFIKIIRIDIAEFFVQCFGKCLFILWRFGKFNYSFISSSDTSSRIGNWRKDIICRYSICLFTCFKQCFVRIIRCHTFTYYIDIIFCSSRYFDSPWIECGKFDGITQNISS